MYSKLPPEARISRTWEGGTESALHDLPDAVLHMTTYDAHPYTPGERGTNENRNGMIRRLFPKTADFSKVSGKSFRMRRARPTACP